MCRPVRCQPLAQCWPDVVDVGLTLKQRLASVSCRRHSIICDPCGDFCYENTSSPVNMERVSNSIIMESTRMTFISLFRHLSAVPGSSVVNKGVCELLYYGVTYLFIQSHSVKNRSLMTEL